VKNVKVNHSVLAVAQSNDGSIAALVGREGVVIDYYEKYSIVRFDDGGTFPFEKHELTEVRTDVFPI
jgi:hypothetical protein